MLRECTCRPEVHTARLLPRAGRPALPMEVKGAGSVTIEASLPALSSFRFLESEPHSRRSGEELPARRSQQGAPSTPTQTLGLQTARQRWQWGPGGPALLRTEPLLWGLALVTPAWQPLFNNLENVYSSAGRLHPWIQKHSGLGVAPSGE